MSDRRAMTSAERQGRLRRRRKLGLLLAATEVPLCLTERLVEAGLLREEDATDPKRLGEALAAAGEKWAGLGQPN